MKCDQTRDCTYGLMAKIKNRKATTKPPNKANSIQFAKVAENQSNMSTKYGLGVYIFPFTCGLKSTSRGGSYWFVNASDQFGILYTETQTRNPRTLNRL